MLLKFKNAWKGFRGNLPVQTKIVECQNPSHYIFEIQKGRVRRELNPSERKEHVSEASGVFTQPVFKKERDLLIESQVYYIAENLKYTDAEDCAIKLAYAQGVLGGLKDFYEAFEELHGEHLSNTKDSTEGENVSPLTHYTMSGEAPD